MTELVQALIGESAYAAPAKILEALPGGLERQSIKGAPHTIYEELWHTAFWQRLTLDWIFGTETPQPPQNSDSFPTAAQAAVESWQPLCRRFLEDANTAAEVAGDPVRLSVVVRCPSHAGRPVRLMTVEEQLISLVTHNAYHLGRIVVLRQLLGSWPPPSGGYSW